MQRKILVIALLLLPLAGCIPDSEFRLAPIGGGNSSGTFSDWWQGKTPTQAPDLPGTGASKMLQDPESREETTSQYVYAFTPEQARSLCRKTAERNGWRLDNVVPENFVNNAGKQKFSCYWTMFTGVSYDHDHNH